LHVVLLYVIYDSSGLEKKTRMIR